MSQGSLLAGIEAARRNWGWFLMLGLVLMILGAITLPMAFIMSVVYVWVWGISLLVGAVFYFVGMFAVRSWEGFFIYLLLGLLSLFVGLFCVRDSLEAAIDLTLVLAVLLTVGGSFRAMSAAILAYPGAIWTILGGIIAVVLGVMIWRRWPGDFWFIGMAVSVDMIIQGATWVSLALALKSRFPQPPAASPPAV